MEFFSEVLNDTLICIKPNLSLSNVFEDTLPYVVGRFILYPFNSVNSRLQGQYQKIQDETESKAVYIKHNSFSLKEKIKCVKEIIAVSGVKGLFSKCEHELVPHSSARLVEGFLFFCLMKFCMERLRIIDSLFLLTGMVLFVVCLTGAFCHKFSHELISSSPKNTFSLLKKIVTLDKHFWNQYEIEFGAYYIYGLIQVYFEVLTFYYLEPGLVLQTLLFTASRLLAGFSTRPLEIMAQWAQDYDYDYDKLFYHIVKKDGKLALFAGAKEMFSYEILLSIIMCIGFKILQ